MSDENVIVAKNGTIFLAGPPLVKAAIKENISAEDLGGGHVHTSISGVSDHLAQNEKHALQLTRDIVSNLNHKNYIAENTHSSVEVEEPLYD